MKGYDEVRRVEIGADIVTKARGALAMFGLPVPADVDAVLDSLPKAGDLLLVVYRKREPAAKG